MGERPIFIVASPRSGTGLLRDLLRSHPRITFPYESHFIPLLYRAYGDPGTEEEAVRLGRDILRLGWVRIWGLDLSREDFRDCRTFRQILECLYGAWAEREGKPRWGDKTPPYAREIPLIREIFPDAQIVHIYRDGRDAARSMLALGFGPRNLYSAARMWRGNVLAARAAGEQLPPDSYCEIRYEDLLASTESTMRALLDFLGERYDPSVLEPSFLERPVRPLFIGSPGRAAVARSTIVADNQAKWRSAMGEREVVLFESVAGDVLDELGYERAGRTRPVSGVERRAWRAHDRVRRFLRRLNIRQKWPATTYVVARARRRIRRREMLPNEGAPARSDETGRA